MVLQWRDGFTRTQAAVCLASAVVLLTVSCVEKSAHDAGVDRIPLTIQLRKDVEVRPDSGASQVRGILYGDTSLTIRKGERIVMQWVGSEGGCRVLYKQRQLELSSCPWLPGFADHQSDIFEIIDHK